MFQQDSVMTDEFLSVSVMNCRLLCIWYVSTIVGALFSRDCFLFLSLCLSAWHWSILVLSPLCLKPLPGLQTPSICCYFQICISCSEPCSEPQMPKYCYYLCVSTCDMPQIPHPPPQNYFNLDLSISWWQPYPCSCWSHYWYPSCPCNPSLYFLQFLLTQTLKYS